MKRTTTLITLSVTFCYCVLFFLLEPEGLDSYPPNPVVAFLGLFTPVAIFTTFATLFIAPIILMILCLKIDAWHTRLDLSQKQRIIYTLEFLFVLTLLVDFIFWGGLHSLVNFMHSLGFFLEYENPMLWSGVFGFLGQLLPNYLGGA